MGARTPAKRLTLRSGHRDTPPVDGSFAVAGLLARGSCALFAFPVSQWHLEAGLAAYSCGGSFGLARQCGRTEFPLGSGTPEHHDRERFLQRPEQVKKDI